MKINNYIVACLSKDWKTIEANGVPFKILISGLIFQVFDGENVFYTVNSRITTCDGDKQLSHSNKAYSNSDPRQVLNFLNSLFSELKISSYNIFKFNSNEDYPLFVDWFKGKQAESILFLEK